MGYLEGRGELKQPEKGYAGRFAFLKSGTLFSLWTFPLVFIVGPRKSRTREGRILHILYRRGKKESEFRLLTTSFLVIEKKKKHLTNREESWEHDGRGRGFPGPAFLRLPSVFCHLTTRHRQLSALQLPLSTVTLPGKTLSSAPRMTLELRGLTLNSIESVEP